MTRDGLHRVLLCLLLAGCARPAAPLASPSGAYVVTIEIAGAEAGPTHRGCVRLVVRDVRAARERTFQTGASDAQKWAVAWTPAEALVLYSSDIGTQTYVIRGGEILERMPDDAEREVARAAYRAKYGRRPPA